MCHSVLHDSKLWLKHYITFEGPSQKEGPGVLATVLPLADKGLIFGANGHFWVHGGIVCFHGLKHKDIDWDLGQRARGGWSCIPHYLPSGKGPWLLKYISLVLD